MQDSQEVSLNEHSVIYFWVNIYSILLHDWRGLWGHPVEKNDLEVVLQSHNFGVTWSENGNINYIQLSSGILLV